MDVCSHTLIVEANAQLNGIRNMMVDISDAPLHYLTGFELSMLLKPVAERLAQAMQIMEAK